MNVKRFVTQANPVVPARSNVTYWNVLIAVVIIHALYLAVPVQSNVIGSVPIKANVSCLAALPVQDFIAMNLAATRCLADIRVPPSVVKSALQPSTVKFVRLNKYWNNVLMM